MGRRNLYFKLNEKSKKKFETWEVENGMCIPLVDWLMLLYYMKTIYPQKMEVIYEFSMDATAYYLEKNGEREDEGLPPLLDTSTLDMNSLEVLFNAEKLKIAIDFIDEVIAHLEKEPLELVDIYEEGSDKFGGREGIKELIENILMYGVFEGEEDYYYSNAFNIALLRDFQNLLKLSLEEGLPHEAFVDN